MKRCSRSVVIRDMQIEITMTYHFADIWLAVTKKEKKETSSCWGGWGEIGNLCVAD